MFERWFVYTTVGECVGFLVPALVGASTVRAPAIVAIFAVVAAGGAEGAALGWAQAHALRPALRELSIRRWTLATAVAAMLAWAIGMVPIAIGDRIEEVPDAVLWPVVGLGSVVLLLTIGTAQWMELRRHLPRAWRWIAATALAWIAGLFVFTAITTPLWQPNQPTALVAIIGVFGGMVMAATVAAVSGLAVVRLLGDAATGFSRPDSDPVGA